MRVNRNEAIAGVPGIIVRDFLRNVGEDFSLAKAEHAANMLHLSPDSARKLMDNLLTLGYISPSEDVKGTWSLTNHGLSLAKARASSISRAKADELMGGFMTRVIAVNASSCDFAYMVATVAVFGSYLRDYERLGDIDLAIDLKDRLDDKERQRELCFARIQLAYQNGRAFRRYMDEAYWPHLEVLRFLKGNSHSFSITPEINDLKELGCPYRIIYPTDPCV